MSHDSGTLSIDFLAGFTIFIIAFIWVLSMIPGLLIGLQGYTIDYDAVAYRTGVILVEDPGEPLSWEVAQPGMDWNKADVQRFGLAVSRDDPNILALDKVNRFFDTATFDYPDDYHNLAIFGDYPYKFNISLRYINTNEPASFIGEVVPEGYGYIRRFVKIKSVSNKSVSYATINGSQLALPGKSEGLINGDNKTTTHIVSILLDNTGLTGQESTVRDPAYQIIPAKESFMINLTYLNSTLNSTPAGATPSLIWDRESCFDITLKSGDIWVSDGSNQRNINDVTIDEAPVYLTNTRTMVKHNVSILYNTTTDRKGLNWDASKINIYLKFNLQPSPGSSTCPCPSTNPDCSGSRFLNSTVKTPLDHPFDYNYDPKNVTQPQLRDAVVEVAVW